MPVIELAALWLEFRVLTMKSIITPSLTRSRVAWSAVVVAWAALLLGGFGSLLAYEFRRGEQAAPSAGAATVLAEWLGERPFQLVLALHPKCPCSRASVAELERLAAQCDGELDYLVLVAAPAGAGDDWLEAPLVRELREKLNATIVHDANGSLAGQLGMHTSGAVVLIDRAGETRFFGGITASRGHEGDSAGEDAIRDIVGGGSAPSSCSPVFGCPLAH